MTVSICNLVEEEITRQDVTDTYEFGCLCPQLRHANIQSIMPFERGNWDECQDVVLVPF